MTREYERDQKENGKLVFKGFPFACKNGIALGYDCDEAA